MGITSKRWADWEREALLDERRRRNDRLHSYAWALMLISYLTAMIIVVASLMNGSC